MRVGKNQITGESEIYLDSEECALMKDVIKGSHLPKKHKFWKIVEEL